MVMGGALTTDIPNPSGFYSNYLFDMTPFSSGAIGDVRNLNLITTPEPSTLLLMLGGLPALAAGIRRRRTQGVNASSAQVG
jgi:hypothetical protein